jgi:hypothetical protein
MTVCSEGEVFATAEEGAIRGATLDCGADGAIRETSGGAVGARRRVKGSRRRNGAGLGTAGAITAAG